MTRCMSLHAPDQGFPNSVEGWGDYPPPPIPKKGDGKFCWENLVYMVVGTCGGVILTIWTFFKAKNNILQILNID